MNYDFKITRNKTLEIQMGFDGCDTSYFDVSCCWTRRLDHAGFMLSFSVLSYSVSVSVADNRHWDDERGCFVDKLGMAEDDEAPIGGPAMKFRKKPVVIEAVQLRWDTWNDMCKFADVGKLSDGKPEGVMLPENKIGLSIPTLEGVMLATENDWIIRGVKGELYPCKPDIFRETYEPADLS